LRFVPTILAQKDYKPATNVDFVFSIKLKIPINLMLLVGYLLSQALGITP
jgi:hypothetical protein